MPNGYAYAESCRALRYRLTLLLHAAERPLTVAEMIEHLDKVGRRPPGRASKAISDSLRWEVGRGRVLRLRRGVYRAGRLDPRTRWWLRRKLDEWDAASPVPQMFERVSDSNALPAWLQAVVPRTAMVRDRPLLKRDSGSVRAAVSEPAVNCR